MNSFNVRKIEIIVLDLLAEFEKEGGKLQVEYDDNAARIREIEDNIRNYIENEDIDFQVFSPRKVDNQSEEKIESMNRDKSNIEEINKSLFRQIKYYSDKANKLKEILAVIEEDRTIELNDDTKNVVEEDITHVDEKILEYYDSIAHEDKEDVYPEEPENIGTEVRSGWRIIKDELSSPINDNLFSINSEADDNILNELTNISNKLEKEAKLIDEDYFRTKEEIKSVLNDITSILETIKK